MAQSPAPPNSSALPSPPPRLLDQLRLTARQRGHPEQTVTAFADWGRRFILFHGKRHSRELGLPEVVGFLEAVARSEKDPVRALAAGRDALEFRCGSGPASQTAPCGAGAGRGGSGPGACRRGRWRFSADGPAAVWLRLAVAGVLPVARQGHQPEPWPDRRARRQGEQGSRGNAAPNGARRPGAATGAAVTAWSARTITT